MADESEDVQSYTYRDYLMFPASMRCELIDGEVFMMSSPIFWHQAITAELHWQLMNFFRNKTCQAIAAPFDVRLFPERDESDDVVVQPDLMVICDKSKYEDGKACKGAPDFIIEVLSRSTRSHDLLRKRALYERAGVKEYWAVGIDTVFQYVLTDGVYAETIHVIKTEPIDIPISLFDNCILRFEPYMDKTEDPAP